jgi:hypothetical protein
MEALHQRVAGNELILRLVIVLLASFHKVGVLAEGGRVSLTFDMNQGLSAVDGGLGKGDGYGRDEAENSRGYDNPTAAQNYRQELIKLEFAIVHWGA